MIAITDKKKCSGCEACFNTCPMKAIEMKADYEGFLYPEVVLEKCIDCNLCVQVCPYKNNWEPSNDLKKSYIGFNLSEKEREISSSGGIFILLAKIIIAQKGVVFGAAYDDGFMVYHSMANTEEELNRLIGSKYLQSRIGNIYSRVRSYLKKGKKVMFVGTTCQIAGLKQYLRKEYGNLLCVDFICLGIPSPKVWKDYIKVFFGNEKIVAVNFKDKSKGWHTFSLSIQTSKQSFLKNGRKTFFFDGYFKGLYSRPCCSECEFKGNKNRVSDITLSDSWGCENFAQDMDDNKGLSNIIVHSEVGMDALLEIKSKLRIREADFNNLIKYNKNYFEASPIGKNRGVFWRDYDRIEKKKLFLKYCSSNYTLRIFYHNIKIMIKKLLT